MLVLDAGTETIRLSVANLQLVLDSQGTGIPMALPASHAEFVAAVSEPGCDPLTLAVQAGPLRQTQDWRPLCTPVGAWQLWLDESGRYVFVTWQRSPPGRQVTVDAGFRSGEVLGLFGIDGDPAAPLAPLYPLQGIDLMLFANWLAESGDLILHASGMAVDGKGCCFIGPAGAGKSTLAAASVGSPDCTLLGEDNLVLRWLEDQFWIYGTPWHLNPAHCSPQGAPLEKLFFLDRTAPHGVAPCAPLDGVARLLQTAFVPYYRPQAVSGILERLALLAQQVPFYTLSYQLGADVLRMIREA